MRALDKTAVLERLDFSAFYREAVQSLRINGKDEAIGLCPFHDDREHPNLHVNLDNGLWKCWAGCGGGSVFDFVIKRDCLTFPQAVDMIGQWSGLSRDRSEEPRRILRRHRWVDVEGRMAWHLRWNREPKFTWAQDADGKQPGRGECTPTLYRVDTLASASEVILAEGERDAETLNAWLDELNKNTIRATCTPNGAGDVKPTYLTALHEKAMVYVSGDNDEPGRAYRNRCADLLYGHVQALRVLQVPQDHKDWADWAKASGTAKQFLTILEQAEPWVRPDPVSGLPLTSLRDLLAEADETISWLVEPHLPTSGLSLLAGKPKAGKSTLARGLALAVARGVSWLNCPTIQGTVFYLALEDKRAEVKRHFEAMGATEADDIRFFIAPSPQDGLAKLRRAAEHERPALIIVDPLVRMVRVKDLNDYAQVSLAFEPLLALGRDTGAHVLAVHHLGKGEREGGDSILGSTAIFAAVDTALILKRSDKYRTLSSIQRYGEDLEEITLTMDPVSKTIAAGPSRHEVDQAQMAEAIFTYLKGQSEPLDEKAIHEAIEGRRAIKQKALRTLMADGKVNRTGEGKSYKPYLYLVPKESGTQVPSIYRVPAVPESKSMLSPQNTNDYASTGESAESVSGTEQSAEASVGRIVEVEEVDLRVD